MKFEADDPSEVRKSGSDGVDRSQGAARAISVITLKITLYILIHHCFSVFH